MKFSTILILLLAYSATAQQPDPTRSMLSLHHDNDFFLLTDRYYSFGLSLSYSRLMERGPGGFARQWRASIYQKAWTPRDIDSGNPADFDRPYVGTAFLRGEYEAAKERFLWGLNLDWGLAGRRSGTGGFQRWYHNNIVRYKAPVWAFELPNTLFVNAGGHILREWSLVEGDFGIDWAPELRMTIGTWDQHAEVGSLFHFGRKQAAEKSQAYYRLGSLQREVFFTLSYHLRSVWRDGSLQGASSGPESELYLSPTPFVHSIGFQFVNRYKRHNYRVEFTYDSPRVRGNLSHKYAGFSYGYSF